MGKGERKKEKPKIGWEAGGGGGGGDFGGGPWGGDGGSGGCSDNGPFIQDLNMNPFFVLS